MERGEKLELVRALSKQAGGLLGRFFLTMLVRAVGTLAIVALFCSGDRFPVDTPDPWGNGDVRCDLGLQRIPLLA
jgi:hypothetical protein